VNYLTTLCEYLRLLWRLRNGKKLSHSKFVRCYLEAFLGGSNYENPLQNHGGGNFFRDPHCVRSATTNNFFFAKKECLEKARNVLCNVCLLPFDPAPDPTIIWATGSGEAEDRGPEPCRGKWHCRLQTTRVCTVQLENAIKLKESLHTDNELQTKRKGCHIFFCGRFVSRFYRLKTRSTPSEIAKDRKELRQFSARTHIYIYIYIYTCFFVRVYVVL
jgi:hypothetical protein